MADARDCLEGFRLRNRVAMSFGILLSVVYLHCRIDQMFGEVIEGDAVFERLVAAKGSVWVCPAAGYMAEQCRSPYVEVVVSDQNSLVWLKVQFGWGNGSCSLLASLDSSTLFYVSELLADAVQFFEGEAKVPVQPGVEVM